MYHYYISLNSTGYISHQILFAYGRASMDHFIGLNDAKGKSPAPRNFSDTQLAVPTGATAGFAGFDYERSQLGRRASDDAGSVKLCSVRMLPVHC